MSKPPNVKKVRPGVYVVKGGAFEEPRLTIEKYETSRRGYAPEIRWDLKLDGKSQPSMFRTGGHLTLAAAADDAGRYHNCHDCGAFCRSRPRSRDRGATVTRRCKYCDHRQEELEQGLARGYMGAAHAGRRYDLAVELTLAALGGVVAQPRHREPDFDDRVRAVYTLLVRGVTS